MKRLKLSLLAAAVLLLAGVVTGCGSSGSSSSTPSSSSTGTETTAQTPPFKTVHSGELTVAYLEYLPRILRQKDGTLTGYEAWLLQQVADKYGLKLNPMPTTFSGAILAVQQNKADVGTGTYYSADRSRQVYFTKPNVNDILGFLMRRDASYNGPASLKGKTIGTENGYVYNDYLDKYYGSGSIKIFPDTTSAVAAVRNGQIDAYIGSTGSGVAVVKQYPDLVLNRLEPGDLDMPEDVRVAPAYQYVNCGNKGLARAISDVLQEKFRDGEWAKQLAPWGLNGSEFSPASVYPKQGC